MGPYFVEKTLLFDHSLNIAKSYGQLCHIYLICVIHCVMYMCLTHLYRFFTMHGGSTHIINMYNLYIIVLYESYVCPLFQHVIINENNERLLLRWLEYVKYTANTQLKQDNLLHVYHTHM